MFFCYALVVILPSALADVTGDPGRSDGLQSYWIVMGSYLII